MLLNFESKCGRYDKFFVQKDVAKRWLIEMLCEDSKATKNVNYEKASRYQDTWNVGEDTFHNYSLGPSQTCNCNSSCKSWIRQATQV